MLYNKKIFLKLIFIFQIVLLAPIILLIILIWPFFKIRIGIIKFYRLGSICLVPEIFLCDKKAGKYKKNEIFLWCGLGKIKNNYLIGKLKGILFFPGFILYPIRNFFLKFKYMHRHIYCQIKYDVKKKAFKTYEKLKTDQRFLKKYGPFVKFTQIEIKKGEDYLEKHFIKRNDNIILFGSRTPIYENEKYISIRNSSIKTQIKSMEYVANNNFKAIRMGRDKIDRLNINSKKIFDYTFSESQSDFLDIFIASRAKFMVAGVTGLNELATVMRVPKLVVDFANFNIINNWNEDYTPILLPKKVFSKSLNRHLSYREIFEKKLLDIGTVDQLPKDCQLIDNSENEILDATKEMIDLIIHHNLNLNYEYKKQIVFWKSFSKFYPENLKIIISPNFFKNNNDLFI